MAKRFNWDQEGRERRAREHGRERVVIDREAEFELDAIAKLRAEAQRDDFHDRVEPARRIAREWRDLPAQGRRLRRDSYFAKTRDVLDQAAEAAPDPVARKIRMYESSLLRLFGRSKP